MSKLDFNLLISQAEEIDQEISYLKSKILEPSKFGLGRNKAVEVLKDLDKELLLMKNKCSQELEIIEAEHASMKSVIKNVEDYLANLGEELDKMEAEAAKHGYQPFASQCYNHSTPYSPDLSGTTDLSMADSQLFTPILPSKKTPRF